MGDDDRAQRRADMTPAINRVVGSRQWRDAHPEPRRAIIPVLADDTVEYILARVSETEGSAYLATVADGEVRILAVRLS